MREKINDKPVRTTEPPAGGMLRTGQVWWAILEAER